MAGILDLPSPNFDARPAGQKIDILLLHYTGMPSAEDALRRLRDPSAKVSAHYVVDEDGSVLRLVEEQARAWHAGQSRWQNATDINSRSIGIELVNPGHEFGYRPFPAAQMSALGELAKRVVERHAIPPERVLGHADVAPMRKQDPGELFDWRWLANAGIGLWPIPRSGPWNDIDFTENLRRFGYDLDGPPGTSPEVAQEAAIRAFCRHFRGWDLTARADAELAAILNGLIDGIDIRS